MTRRHFLRRAFCPSLIAAATFAGTGCGTVQPIHRWKQRLTSVTEEQGQGDPNFVRYTASVHSKDSPRPAQIRFNEIGIRGPGMSRYADEHDVNGVLVGQQGTTLIFLVGVVRRPYVGGSTLEDIRLVSWTVRGGVHAWQQSPPDSEALLGYLAVDETCKADAGASPSYHYFPRVNDVFSVEADGGQAVVREKRSGATWRLNLRQEDVPSTRGPTRTAEFTPRTQGPRAANAPEQR